MELRHGQDDLGVLAARGVERAVNSLLSRSSETSRYPIMGHRVQMPQGA